VEPGTIIEPPAGTYSFQTGVTFDTSHIVIRGQGMDQTILDFSGQTTGSQGILARGDHFVVQDFTVLDTAGDGIKTEFVDGPIFQRVKVEWTSGPSGQNGDYGIYPAECTNVLIDEVTVIGARDAGLYVGQSHTVVVRNSTAMFNVLGIEIENTFSLRDPTASPPREVMIETRLLVLRDDGWFGLPYLWDATETSAVYTPQGATVNSNLLTDEDELLNVDYSVPARTDCGSCHFGAGGDVPIGPVARNMNRDWPWKAENQLDGLSREGLLLYAPPSDQVPVLPIWNDPADGTVAERARAYLESNCAACHNPAGRAGFTGLWLEADRPLGTATGVCKQPVAAGSANLGLTYGIEPGDPSRSILVQRMADLRPAIKMPEIEKATVHTEGLALITQWVEEMNLPLCPVLPTP
jgi:uncharacterized repeat protein (TIGR03806 family)